ncbi:MAG: hypothetical protein KAU58_01430, partial [Candidatus Omnitrophica bacterium]|nr:hypothetical protein [Candidatus Omnitrophota bacterium]
MSTKARTLAKGSILRMTNFFIQIGIAFFMMPFIIHSLGDKMYGLWIVIGSFFAFYSLFELGLDSGIQRYLSREIGKKDYKEANVVFNTSLFIFSLIGLFLLSLT